MKKPKYKKVIVMGKTYRLKVARYKDYVKRVKSINPPGD